MQNRGSLLAAILHLETSEQPLKLPCSSEEPQWSPEERPGAEENDQEWRKPGEWCPKPLDHLLVWRSSLTTTGPVEKQAWE